MRAKSIIKLFRMNTLPARLNRINTLRLKHPANPNLSNTLRKIRGGRGTTKIEPKNLAFLPHLSPFLFLAQSAAILFLALPLHAQTNKNLILLDPAHGGSDSGAKLSDSVTEKQLTLAFTAKLRTLLNAANFTVVTTHDADSDLLSPDQRAGLANHAHASACLILHATSVGSGVHIFTSALTPLNIEPSPYAPIPWDTAQAAYLTQSLRLSNQLGATLIADKLPALLTHASVPPLDNLTCPAVIIEIAPLVNPSSDITPVTDAAYQQQIAVALTQALTTRRGKYEPPPPHPPPIAKPTTPSEKPANTPTEMPTEKPTEKPVTPAPPPAITPAPAKPNGVKP